MRVLVTGSSGRAGSFTVRELASHNHEVYHIDRIHPTAGRLAGSIAQDPLPGRFDTVDLTDIGGVYDAFARIRPEGVCHIAANPSPGGFPRQELFHNNVMSTYNVMQASGDFGVRRLVYASSEMATGWLTTHEHPKRFPFDESDRADTPNAYALSKYLGEIIADSMIVRYPTLTTVGLRISNIMLPGGYDVLAERRAGYPEAGSANYWSYVDVRDVASAFRAALEGVSAGNEVFLVAAADTCLDVPLSKALKECYGIDVKLPKDRDEHASAFDCSKMKKFFRWTAKYSWRQE